MSVAFDPVVGHGSGLSWKDSLDPTTRRPEGVSAMADLLSLDQVRELITHDAGPCVSLFLPTHRTAPESEQDPIRLKNLLAEAEEVLARVGLRPPETRELLGPATGLHDLEGFWRYQADGLAIYLAAGFARFFRLPLELPELAVVTERFHVKPLLPLLATDGRFFVLAISGNEVRLLEGSRQRVDEVELDDVPESLAEALRYDDLEKERTFHVAGRGGRSGPAIFHGHGIGDEVDRVLHERFLREVDAGLWEILREQRAPLVVAGVEELRAIFREVTRYGHVLEDGIEGNPEELRPEELHARAWELVGPVFDREREEAVSRFAERAGRGEGATADLRQVVLAALDGRVETLFVAVGEQRWGTFDEGTREVALHAERAPRDEDLLDRAAVLTLATSGSVYAVALDRVPGAGEIAAVLRY